MLGKGREEKGLRKGTGCKIKLRKKEKRIKYKENTVPITPVWKTLVQKSYTGPKGTKYNVSVDSYLHEKAQ